MADIEDDNDYYSDGDDNVYDEWPSEDEDAGVSAVKPSRDSDSDEDSDEDSDQETDEDSDHQVDHQVDQNTVRTVETKSINLSPLMTKYEYARLVAEWATLLQKYPNIKSVSGTVDEDIIVIAENDVINAPEKVPLIIRRALPSGEYRDFSPDELIPPPRHFSYKG